MAWHTVVLACVGLGTMTSTKTSCPAYSQAGCPDKGCFFRNVDETKHLCLHVCKLFVYAPHLVPPLLSSLCF